MCFLAFSHQCLDKFSFQSNRLLFSHASAEVRGENTTGRKFALAGDRTHNVVNGIMINPAGRVGMGGGEARKSVLVAQHRHM